MTTVTSTIVRAEAPDLEVVTDTLGRAFQLDPVACWVTPDGVRRRSVLPAFFGLVAAATLEGGEVHVRTDGRAAALWEPPGSSPPDPAAEVAFTAALHETIGADALRVSEVMAALAGQRPDEPSWYLAFVGVAPELQGCGVGTTLLAPMLDRCDTEQRAIYLEASSLGSRRLYERLGFRAIGQVDLPDGGPPVWPMWREPRTPGWWGGRTDRPLSRWSRRRGGGRHQEEPR